MKQYFSWVDRKKAGIFAAGVLFGTAGIKLLTSKKAKDFYASCGAAALCARDEALDVVSRVQANAEDVYAQAKAIHAKNKEQGEAESGEA